MNCDCNQGRNGPCKCEGEPLAWWETAMVAAVTILTFFLAVWMAFRAYEVIAWQT